MGTVLVDVTISLDGFMAGPRISPEHPMGEGGERLHEWLLNPTDELDAEVARAVAPEVGAVVLGRGIYDVGRALWGGTPYPAPSYVLTHRAHEPVTTPTGEFVFVTDGPRAACALAREAAGDRSVAVMGADVTQQFLRAGLLDDLHVHIAPCLLGDGLRLFDRLAPGDVEQVASRSSAKMTHLRYRVVR